LDETARRKPEKAQGGRIEAAKALYARLLHITVPNPLPRSDMVGPSSLATPQVSSFDLTCIETDGPRT
jgi:hypothetical protein